MSIIAVLVLVATRWLVGNTHTEAVADHFQRHGSNSSGAIAAVIAVSSPHCQFLLLNYRIYKQKNSLNNSSSQLLLLLVLLWLRLLLHLLFHLHRPR